MHAQTGFTMVELMVVTAILSVVAGVAVPNLVTSRAVANERAVLATLRTVATAQAQCQIGCVADRDGDGRGEALALDQLAGGRALADGSRLTPATLPASLGLLDAAGVAQNRGYLLALYLPDGSGQAVLASAANEAAVAPELAGQVWSCVAWPMVRGRTGTATYFVNQTGEILVAKNATYDGKATVPPGAAALAGVGPNDLLGTELAVGVAGADGFVWQLVR
ncbi:MAG: type II secretion system protein [Planctomycetes bacterium]|nr:type II secretion system protein [Planctomycetota bacterium]